MLRLTEEMISQLNEWTEQNVPFQDDIISTSDLYKAIANEPRRELHVDAENLTMAGLELLEYIIADSHNIGSLHIENLDAESTPHNLFSKFEHSDQLYSLGLWNCDLNGHDPYYDGNFISDNIAKLNLSSLDINQCNLGDFLENLGRDLATYSTRPMSIDISQYQHGEQTAITQQDAEAFLKSIMFTQIHYVQICGETQSHLSNIRAEHAVIQSQVSAELDPFLHMQELNDMVLECLGNTFDMVEADQG